MKLLLDTNIVIDALATREPFAKSAQQLLVLAAQNRLQAYITANAFFDIYYVCRKVYPDGRVRELLRILTETVKIVPVTELDCRRTLNSDVGDVEDAAYLQCGKKIRAQYLVTRDEALLALSHIPVTVLPEKVLQHIDAVDAIG